MSTNLIIFDKVNKGIVTVPYAFASRNKSVLSLIWRPEIKVGVPISPGSALADIQWDDNEEEALYTPDDCNGEIESINRNISLDNLRYRPPVYLLFLPY